jgi:hypothetical protein
MDAFTFKPECTALAEKYSTALSILLASCQDVVLAADMEHVSRCNSLGKEIRPRAEVNAKEL